MNAIEDLQHSDPKRRQQAISIVARQGNRQALPALRKVAQGDPVPSLRAFAGKAIEHIEAAAKPNFMKSVDKRAKGTPMPSPFVEEVIRLTPVPRTVGGKQSFAAKLETRRQYSDDAEQYEFSTPRNWLPLMMVALAVLMMAALVGMMVLR